MSKVYVPYYPHKLDRHTQQLVPTVDLSPAEEHGELVFLLSPNANPLGDVQNMVEQLHSKLENITDEDFLLLVGNPSIIALVASIASEYTSGILRLLQWHGHQRKYIQVRADIN